MSDASGAVSTNLSGVFGTDKERLHGALWPLEFGEMLRNELGVVETASADVAVDSGERNDDGFCL